MQKKLLSLPGPSLEKLMAEVYSPNDPTDQWQTLSIT